MWWLTRDSQGDKLNRVESAARILIVDDEPQIARVLRTGLRTHGYEVRVAADGVSALETFSDWHPDLVVTDLAMPNMDGLDLCRHLRISQLPIIVLSVRGEEKTRSKHSTPALTTTSQSLSGWTSCWHECVPQLDGHDSRRHRSRFGGFGNRGIFVLTLMLAGFSFARWKSI